uniref:Putative F-box protein n=1 Tax=Noccaea caerulescens TaxID=107243 RepID=A0A1J3IC68_NOCCA
MCSPVFEIICGFDGSIKFFLHGVDKEDSCFNPGFVNGIEKCCNVLLLEVEPRQRERRFCSEIEIEFEMEREEFSRKLLLGKNERGVVLFL